MCIRDSPTTGNPQQSAGTPNVTTSPATGAGQRRGKWEVYTDAEGRKWFGEVPYDVFFDDPLGVANDNEPVAMTSPPDMGSASVKTPDPGTKAEANPVTAAASGDDWPSAITAEELNAEVKAIRNFLNPKLQNTGQYYSNMSMIPHHAATLAALAGVAAQHPGEISWKADALYIRDLAGSMNEKPLQRSPTFQRRLLGLFEQISDTLNRSRPADLEEPDAEASIADYAEMPMLMKRMDEAYKTMKTNAGSEPAFRKNTDMIRRQAAALGALAKVITTEGYGYEDDDEFIAFAKTVMQESRNMVDSTTLESFESFDASMSKAYASCTQCHTGYK